MADDDQHDGRQNPDARRRRGRRPVPPERARRHPVTCRLTDAERDRIDTRRGEITRGEYLRRAALRRLPRPVPQINRDAWAELARLAANLNQIAHRMNIDPKSPGPSQSEIWDLREAVDQLRFDLIGLPAASEEDEEQ